jgi:beta-phosphoglucomutase-like phosphatase (HAD superfamily)
MTPPPVRAVLWDFDNTLVDTRAKNRAVTRRIMSTVTGRDPDEIPALRSVDAYHAALHRTQNWRALYRDELGLSPEQIEASLGLWTEYQLADSTPTPFFNGIVGVVRALDHLPQAIVSLNTRDNILATLEQASLADAFALVVGCEEVWRDRQKPAPDGVLYCIERLTDENTGSVLFVGDHPIDAECAASATSQLAGQGSAMQVAAVAATYGSAGDGLVWPIEPTFRLSRPDELLGIVGTVTRGDAG